MLENNKKRIDQFMEKKNYPGTLELFVWKIFSIKSTANEINKNHCV